MPDMTPATGLSAHDWSQFLSRKLGQPVVVTFGNARRQVVQSRGFWNDPSGAPVAVRLARFFSEASPEVQAALAAWLRQGRRSRRSPASRLLDDFITKSLAALPPKKPRSTSTQALEPQGQAHDLTLLVEGLLVGAAAEFTSEDFAPRGLPSITWGRRALSRAKRSLQLGCYAEDSHSIRIHRVLDQAHVPLFVVRFVVFHELLHAVRSVAAGAPGTDAKTRARRLHHDRAFRQREALYGDCAAAQAWQDENVSRLLRSARTGKEFKPRRRGLGSLFGA